MFDFNVTYPSHRSPVLSRNIVATSQPLAAQAGLRMLLAGGNAVDAALASAIALTIVEPTSNGIGSDAFAILWDGKALHGLNASGRSPAAWTPEKFAGLKFIPNRGWDAVTVPGAVSAWVELSRRFGKLKFEDLFAPAIEYAENGFAVSPIIAHGWAEQARELRKFETFAQTFLPDGRPPRPGEIFRFPDAARTLEEIARTQGESFYRGELARAIADYAASTGGAITLDDLSTHCADWVDPMSLDYAGWRVHEIPPNGQGIAALIALGMLAHTNLKHHAPESADAVHLQLEAMKLAFADAHRYVSDPATRDIDFIDLLDEDYLRRRAKLIDPHRAGEPTFGIPRGGGTVYLAAADASGMMVSFIQSNYAGFGSGIVVPGTGISLQNRGLGFTLQPGHPNQVGPRKRPYHTIIPAFVTRSGQPVMAFGVMGGPMQPQGHVQMINRMFLWNQDPQAAADAPRWRVIDKRTIALESDFASEAFEELTRRGHVIVRREADAFGGAQLIYRADDTYIAGSDPRKDGQAVGY